MAHHNQSEHTHLIPTNPLVDQHPVDTLVHIQEVLAFLQDYVLKSIEEAEASPSEARMYTGHYCLLKMVYDALEYEIQRCDLPFVPETIN